MDSMLLYILETSICLTLFYLIYILLLWRDTFFRINRIYLISSVAISYIIPLINFSLNSNLPDINTYTTPLQTIVVNANNVEIAVRQTLNSLQILLIIYFIGVGIFFVRFITQLIKIYLLIKRNGISLLKEYKVVYIKDDFATFSFFNLIFLNKSFQYNSDTEQILVHEKIHINKLHTFDIILMEVFTIFQWFNPIIHLYKKSIKEIHEFQADESVIKQGYNKINYQKLILKQILGADLFSFTNNFNYSTIKRRIFMMTKIKSNKNAVLKLLLVIPVSALLVLAFSCSKNNDNLFVWQTLKDLDSKTNIVLDSFPKFPGDYGEYLSEHLKIPEAIIKTGIPGKIAVRFEIDTDGSIQNVRIGQTLRFKGKWKAQKLGLGCDENALNFVSNMPNWKPAIYKGKPVKKTQSLILFFGNQKMFAKWEKYYENQYYEIINRKSQK